jgi:hypothetical protein
MSFEKIGDAWSVLGCMCEIADLAALERVSKSVRESFDVNCDEVWKFHCATLWMHKQNHPLERWVRLQADEMCGAAASSEVSEEFDSLLEQSTGKTSRRLEEMKGFIENLPAFPGADQIDEDSDLYSMMKAIELANKIYVDNYEDMVARARELETKKEGKRDGNENERSDSEQSRVAAPISRALKAEVVSAELAFVKHLASVGGTRTPFEMDKDVEPIIKTLSQWYEGRSLESARCNHLAVYAAEMQCAGRLLTWKESLHASIKDAKRTAITYHEMREMGTWLIRFHQQLETCAFLQGGTKFVDNRAFKDVSCEIKLRGSEMMFSNIREIAHLFRVEADWGWRMQCENGWVELISIDQSAISLTGERNFTKVTKNLCGKNGQKKDEDGDLEDIRLLDSPFVRDPTWHDMNYIL